MSDLISPWVPEADKVRHQILGKAAEEASELSKILVRCMIQGLDESEPVTSKSNLKALDEEASDVTATLLWLEENNMLKIDYDRVRRKLDGFHRWQKMLEEME